MAKKHAEDGNLTMITGISEPRSIPRLFMLWTGEDWVRCEDEPRGNARLGYTSLEGAIEAITYFGYHGIRAKAVLVATGRGRVPFVEDSFALPNDEISDPETIPEFYMLWTGDEWMPALDAIGDPCVCYLNNTDAEDGYDDHMDDGLLCMPILCRDNEEEAKLRTHDRSRGATLSDERKREIVALASQGVSRNKIAKMVGTHRGAVSRVLNESKLTA